MQVVHVRARGRAVDDGEVPASERRVLASDAEPADTLLEQARGLMFRRAIREDYALVFRFDKPEIRGLHMVFVPFAIDALWLVDDEVTRRQRLRPWIGLGRGTADTVIELPAGAADGVELGDVVRIVE